MKLLEHLETLSKQDQKHFLALSKSWYPQAKVPLDFLNYLIDSLQCSEGLDSVVEAYRKTSKLSQKRLQNIQTTILSWFKRFLANISYRELNLPDVVAYVKFCLDQQINQRYIQGLRKQSIQRQDFSGADKLREMYLIHNLLYYHPLALEKDNVYDPVFQKMTFYFDAYQTCIRLEHWLEALARKTIASTSDVISNLNVKIPDYISTYPIIKAFKVLIVAYSYPSLENVINAKEVVWKHLKEFTDNQQAEFLHRIKNLYAFLIRSKQIDSVSAAGYLFEHYKLLDQKNYLLDGERMQHRTFTNIVHVAIKVKEYVWIEKFIRRYQSAIPSQERRSIIALSKADVLFSQAKFRKAINTLPKRVRDPLIEIRCKGLEICCMVELDMDEFAIEQKCKSLSVKLGRNANISVEVLQAARNFLNIVRKLISRDKEKAELERYFYEITTIFFHDWLAQRIRDYRRYRN